MLHWKPEPVSDPSTGPPPDDDDDKDQDDDGSYEDRDWGGHSDNDFSDQNGLDKPDTDFFEDSYDAFIGFSDFNGGSYLDGGGYSTQRVNKGHTKGRIADLAISMDTLSIYDQPFGSRPPFLLLIQDIDEMEAAGLVDVLPRLVTRGACDDAEPLKKKPWQAYTSSTGVACTKAPSSAIPAIEADQDPLDRYSKNPASQFNPSKGAEDFVASCTSGERTAISHTLDPFKSTVARDCESNGIDVCEHCGELYRSKSHRKEHTYEHMPKPFECHVTGCKRHSNCFPTSNDLGRHIRTQHIKSVHNDGSQARCESASPSGAQTSSRRTGSANHRFLSGDPWGFTTLLIGFEAVMRARRELDSMKRRHDYMMLKRALWTLEFNSIRLELESESLKTQPNELEQILESLSDKDTTSKSNKSQGGFRRKESLNGTFLSNQRQKKRITDTISRPMPAIQSKPSTNYRYSYLRHLRNTGIESWYSTRLLGRGSQAIVDAMTSDSGFRMARKTISASHPLARHSFSNEIRTLGAMEHPHITQILGVSVSELGYEVYLSPVADTNLQLLLSQAMQGRTKIALSQVACLISALEQIHDRGFVHNDIKPSNILVDHWSGHPQHGEPTASQNLNDQPNDHPRFTLADFGLSRYLLDTSPRSQARQRCAGTPMYAAPEGINSPSSDIWSLGCVLLEIVTWCLMENHPQEALNKHLLRQPYHADPDRIHTWLAGLDPGDDMEAKAMMLLTREMLAPRSPEDRPTARGIMSRLPWKCTCDMNK